MPFKSQLQGLELFFSHCIIFVWSGLILLNKKQQQQISYMFSYVRRFLNILSSFYKSKYHNNNNNNINNNNNNS